METEKHIAKCIGRRHVEVSKLSDGNILVELKWRGTQTLCGLVFTPDEALKFWLGLHEALK